MGPYATPHGARHVAAFALTLFAACSGGGAGGGLDGGLGGEPSVGGYGQSDSGTPVGTGGSAGGFNAVGGFGAAGGFAGGAGTASGGIGGGGTSGNSGSGGSSGCGPGQASCPSGCADLTADPNNCGACQTVCSTSTSGTVALCAGGQCVEKCAGAGQNLCSSGCVDMTTDLKNCGGCGKSCKAPYCKQAIACQEGQCLIGPVPDGSYCGSTFTHFCASGSCEATKTYCECKDGSCLRKYYQAPAQVWVATPVAYCKCVGNVLESKSTAGSQPLYQDSCSVCLPSVEVPGSFACLE